jgi:hypothetical protein
MFPSKLLTVGAVIVSLTVAGCQKKQPKTTAQPVTTPAAQQAPAQSESDDIFNEFYQDGNNSGGTVSSKNTFKPAGSFQSGSFSPSFSDNGRYVVQITTVRSSSLAENLKEKMLGLGYPAYVAEVQNPTPALSGTYYRVRIGPFSRILHAKEFGENILRQNSYDYWVDNKANDMVGIDGYGLGNADNGYNSSNFSTPSSSTPGYESTYTTPSSPSTTYETATPSSTSSSTTTPSSDVWSSSSPSTSIPSSTIESQPTAQPGTSTGTEATDTSSWGNSSW